MGEWSGKGKGRKIRVRQRRRDRVTGKGQSGGEEAQKREETIVLEKGSPEYLVLTGVLYLFILDLHLRIALESPGELKQCLWPGWFCLVSCRLYFSLYAPWLGPLDLGSTL